MKKSTEIVFVAVVVILVLVSVVWLSFVGKKKESENKPVKNIVNHKSKKVYIGYRITQDTSDVIKNIYTGIRVDYKPSPNLHITLLYINDIIGIDRDRVEEQIKNTTFTYLKDLPSQNWTFRKWFNTKNTAIIVLELDDSGEIVEEIENSIKTQIIDLIQTTYSYVKKSEKKMNLENYDIEIYHFKSVIDSRTLEIHFKKYKSPKLHITTGRYSDIFHRVLGVQQTLLDIIKIDKFHSL